jgi:hypothetical protein
VYAWTGSGEPTKVSSPPTPGEAQVRGIGTTVARVNRAHVHNAFGHYDPEERMLRWFVPLDSDITNRYALVYDLDVGAWSLDTVEDVTYVASVVDGAGVQRTLAGDIHGQLWELDTGESDGAYGFEPVQEVQAGSTRATFSVSGTPLPTSGDGLAGVPVLLVDSAGDVVRCRVASNTSSVVTLTTYLTTAPSAGTKAIFGGIHREVASGRFTYEDPALVKILEAVKVTFAREAAGTFWVSWLVDNGSFAVVSAAGGSGSASDGEEHFWVRARGRRLGLRLDSFTPGTQAGWQAFQTWVRVRDE